MTQEKDVGKLDVFTGYHEKRGLMDACSFERHSTRSSSINGGSGTHTHGKRSDGVWRLHLVAIWFVWRVTTLLHRDLRNTK